jgi:hypothetical protein
VTDRHGDETPIQAAMAINEELGGAVDVDAVGHRFERRQSPDHSTCLPAP